MNLKELMELSAARGNNIRQVVSEERIKAQMENIRHLIAFYREYPDIFVDDIKGPDSQFKFFFYQRIFIRVAMRHRYVFATYPRG